MWAARLLLMSATLILFGSSLFFVYVFQVAGAEAIASVRAWTRRLLRFSAAGALLATLVGLLLESIVAAGGVRDGLSWPAAASVVTQTRFGRVCMLRAALLVLALALRLPLEASRRPQWHLQSLCGAAAVATLVWTGHGSAGVGMAGFLHRGADLLHLFSAAVWAGALLPLAILVLRGSRHPSGLDTRLLGAGLVQFSGFAPVIVALLVLSGAVNTAFGIGLGSWHHAAAWRSAVASPYFRVLFAKLALFALMLVLAAVNRYRLVPRLTALPSAPTVQRTTLGSLRRSLLAETLLALAVLAAVAVLGTLEPPDTVLSLRAVQRYG